MSKCPEPVLTFAIILMLKLCQTKLFINTPQGTLNRVVIIHYGMIVSGHCPWKHNFQSQ